MMFSIRVENSVDLDQMASLEASCLGSILFCRTRVKPKQVPTVKTLYIDYLYDSKILYNVNVFAQMYEFSLNLNSLQQNFKIQFNFNLFGDKLCRCKEGCTCICP